MHKRDILTRQTIKPKLLERAKEFRRSMTPAESSLWRHLRTGKLNSHHFRRQQIIGSYIVDFYCHRSGTVVEVDGGVHKDQAERDQERDEFLKSLELNVLRFTNTEVENDLPRVLSLILAACENGGE